MLQYLDMLCSSQTCWDVHFCQQGHSEGKWRVWKECGRRQSSLCKSLGNRAESCGGNLSICQSDAGPAQHCNQTALESRDQRWSLPLCKLVAQKLLRTSLQKLCCGRSPLATCLGPREEHAVARICACRSVRVRNEPGTGRKVQKGRMAYSQWTKARLVQRDQAELLQILQAGLRRLLRLIDWTLPIKVSLSLS